MVRGRPLCVEEREEISQGLAENLPGRLIAERLGRHRSVIDREIGRNGGCLEYRAHDAKAQWQAARGAALPGPAISEVSWSQVVSASALR